MDKQSIIDNVLADGTATGHRHRAVGKGVSVFQVSDNERELIAPDGAEVVHDEHGVIAVDGDRRVGQVQEYDPLDKQMKTVVD